MDQKQRFNAITNLRVVAISAIMLNHAQIGIQSDTQYSLTYLAYGQFFKFGSLLFMIISGFLFHRTMAKYSWKSLLKRKAMTILLPSLLFMLPWAILNIFVFPNLGSTTQNVDLPFVWNQLYNLFFRSIYWFPINLFLILAANTFIRDVRLLKILLIPAILITLFYSINIYFHWVPRKHNSAILAYFTFFFIGRLIYVYYPELKALLENLHKKRIAKIAGICLLIVFFGASVIESMQIQANNLNTDPGNILRISNILYTFVLLAMLFNFRNRINTGSNFKEKSVFLIYLIHPYLLFIGKHLAAMYDFNSGFHSAKIIPLEVVYALMLLLISLFIAKKLQRNKAFNQIISGDFNFGRNKEQDAPPQMSVHDSAR